MALLVPATTARADSVTDLGTVLPNGLAVDDVHVFLAVQAADSVQVRTHTGALVATVPDQTGALRLTLNSDRSRLFVLLSDGHITAIDTTTTTFPEVGRWSMPAGVCGQDIAWAGSSLFVGYSNCSSADSSVATLDTADPTAQLSAAFFHQAPGAGFTGIEGGGNVLAMHFWDGVGAEQTVVSFDASTDPPTQLASAPAGKYCFDAAVSADGSEVTLACTGGLTTRRTSDLVMTNSYPGPYASWQASSVAESSGVLAVEGDDDENVDIFVRGRSSRLRTVWWKNSASVWRDQLALTPDASRLFAVTRTTDGPGGQGAVTHSDLRIVTYPGLVPLQPALSLTAGKPTYSYGANALVTAHLGATEHNRRVDIYATPVNGTRKLIKSGNVDASGNLAVHYTLTRGTTFWALFAADDRYAAGKVKLLVKPRAKLYETLYDAYGTKGKYALYRLKKDPVIGVLAVPNQRHAHSCLRFKLQHRANGAWHKVATERCRKVSRDGTRFGRLGGPHVDGARFRIRAVLHNSDYSKRTIGPWVYVKFQRR